MISQPHLLDDVVSSAPCFNFQAFAEPVDCLVMRAIHARKTMRRRSLAPKLLNVVIFLLGQPMPWNIELERAAKRDVENLQTLANGEDR